MDFDEITKKSAWELAQLIKERKLQSQDVVKVFLDRIESLDPRIKAFLEIFRDHAVIEAQKIDNRLDRGEDVGPLAGVPIAIKDNIAIQGKRTTCASKILQNFVSPYDATVITKLRQAGAIFIGKTNLDEFAMGSSTENSAYQVTRNPWNTECIPGGSSGGSAAAVASRMAPLAIGSDTGGSIRQPAAMCGICGLKPTYGMVSRYGLVAFASSLDQIGPMAHNITDTAFLYGIMAGSDVNDSTSLPVNVTPGNFTPDKLATGINGLRLGIPKEYFVKGISNEVEQHVKDAINILEKEGARVVEISLPHTEYAVAVYYILAPSEASSNLARYDGMRYGYKTEKAANLMEEYACSREEGFGSEVKRRIMLGAYALCAGYYEAYYGKAQRVRTLIKQDFENAFKNVDVIVTPTAPTPAFKIGEKANDPLAMYLSDIFTISCNLAGIPGLAMPCGFSKDGLPIGIQFLGKPLDEINLFKTAYTYEKLNTWHQHIPSFDFSPKIK